MCDLNNAYSSSQHGSMHLDRSPNTVRSQIVQTRQGLYSWNLVRHCVLEVADTSNAKGAQAEHTRICCWCRMCACRALSCLATFQLLSGRKSVWKAVCQLGSVQVKAKWIVTAMAQASILSPRPAPPVSSSGAANGSVNPPLLISSAAANATTMQPVCCTAMMWVASLHANKVCTHAACCSSLLQST